jgi:hypothetical protein
LAPCDFWLFPKTEDRFEGPIFPTLPTFGDVRRPSCRAFHKRSSRNVLSSANTGSLSVLVSKETTSKVKATISVYVIKYSFYGGNSGNLIVTPRIWYRRDDRERSPKSLARRLRRLCT